MKLSIFMWVAIAAVVVYVLSKTYESFTPGQTGAIAGASILGVLLLPLVLLIVGGLFYVLMYDASFGRVM